MNPQLYQQFCDPLVGLSSQRLAALLNLHALLFETPVVQDNFILSRLFYKAEQEFGVALAERVRSGLLAIALRSNVESLADLRDLLRDQIESQRYQHFATEAPATEFVYNSSEFGRFLAPIDAVRIHGQLLRWNQTRLGIRFRARMRQTAESGESGLTSGEAMAIWRHVEATSAEKAELGRHRRTYYDKCAAAQSDPAHRDAIMRWVNTNYLPNLPDALDLSLSVPNATLLEIGLPSAFVPIERVYAEVQALPGYDSAIMSETFLSSLDLKSIAEFRSWKEFVRLQTAIRANDLRAAKFWLGQYLQRLAAEGPRHFASWKATIRRAEAYEHAMVVVGLIGQSLVVYFRSPHLAAAVTLLSVSLAAKGLSREISQAAADKARQGMIAGAIAERSRPPAEVVHE